MIPPQATASILGLYRLIAASGWDIARVSRFNRSENGKWLCTKGNFARKKCRPRKTHCRTGYPS
jgi:hypothetical protein